MKVQHDFDREERIYRVSSDDSHAKVNVVFVHGLGGSGYSTWNSGPHSELGFWPQNLAADCSHCCVWTTNYKTNVYQWNPFSRSRIDLLDRASWFVHSLLQAGVASRPIVFVAHSLGGLLVKQALQFARSLGPREWQVVWEKTRAVVFLATPHDGSKLADAAVHAAEAIGGLGLATRFFFRPSPDLKNLLDSNPTLRYLSDWYRNHAPDAGVETLAFAEGRQFRGFMVVDPSSANPQVPNCMVVPLPADDHVSIAKPANKDALVYAKVKGLLNEIAARNAATGLSTKGGAGKDALEMITGDWWGHVDTIGHESVLSLTRIERHVESAAPVIRGVSFDSEGQVVAEWWSKYSDIRLSQKNNEIELDYLFGGKRQDRKSSVEGHSAFRFPISPASADPIRRGSGHFFSVYVADETVESRDIKLRRAVEVADVKLLWEVDNDPRCREVVLRTLRDVWGQTF